MPHFVKNPITIEAFQLTPDTSSEQLAELGIYPTPYIHGQFTIPTLEGPMQAQYGDWIIKGIRGEIYACKDDIFRETYTQVG